MVPNIPVNAAATRQLKINALQPKLVEASNLLTAFSVRPHDVGDKECENVGKKEEGKKK